MVRNDEQQAAKRESYYEDNVRCFTATRSIIKMERALNLDKLYEAEAVHYPGRLENIKLAQDLTPKIRALLKIFQFESERILPEVAAFIERWQEGKTRTVAKKLSDGGYEEQRELGRQSFNCYLKGIEWGEEDSGAGSTCGWMLRMIAVPYSASLSDLMEAVDNLVVAFRSYPSIAAQLKRS